MSNLHINSNWCQDMNQRESKVEGVKGLGMSWGILIVMIPSPGWSCASQPRRHKGPRIPCSVGRKCGVEVRAGLQTAWVCIPVVLLSSSVALGKLPNLSIPWFLGLYNQDKGSAHPHKGMVKIWWLNRFKALRTVTDIVSSQQMLLLLWSCLLLYNFPLALWHLDYSVEYSYKNVWNLSIVIIERKPQDLLRFLAPN